MYSEIHFNRVLYKSDPKPRNRYRQIVVEEREQFEVRISKGDVAQTEPEFRSTDAEVYFHSTLKAALADAEKEFQASVAAGWKPYTPQNPNGP